MIKLKLKRVSILLLVVLVSFVFPLQSDAAKPVVLLSNMDWEPYTGEHLSGYGFFSEIVTEAFAHAGYEVKYQFRPWSRALWEARKGETDGVMVAYQNADRMAYLEFPDVAWKVKEEFISLKERGVTFNGSSRQLKGYVIGSLLHSAQAEELRKEGLRVDVVASQYQNVKKLLARRIDVMLVPRRVLFYHLQHIDPEFDHDRIQILRPHFKVYNLYVAFSKQRPGYQKLTTDFNRGLRHIKQKGIYRKILKKHNILAENN